MIYIMPGLFFRERMRMKMRGVVVFLCAALGCSLAEGHLVSKCDLRDKLTTAIDDLPDKIKVGLPENIVPLIVCHVELASGFNTSAVNLLSPGEEEHETRRKRAPSGTRSSHLDDEIWELYGLFQLTNHLVCSDGTTPSPNICGIDCNNLVDVDISDDIECLLKILTTLVEEGFGAAHWEELKRMVRLVLQQECRDEKASEYFTDCP